MQLEFWGAAREVTGSMHLLRVGRKNLLIDCGLAQGRRKQTFARNRNLPFEASSIDAVILTHAHLDHAGNLPSLVRAGFRGKIFTTSATEDLCSYMLVDSAHIQKSDVRYVNRRRKREGTTRNYAPVGAARWRYGIHGSVPISPEAGRARTASCNAAACRPDEAGRAVAGKAPPGSDGLTSGRGPL